MVNSESVAEHASASQGRIAPFGKYLLLQRVSVGGMAEVFKAIPEGAARIDQIVAIKRILPNIAEDNEFIGMFIDEARIAGQLTHPNVCRIYELGRVGGDHYIAMQFLWGRDLLKVMNRFKKVGEVVPAPMAAFIASKACAALHYAHTKHDATGRPLNIIHRDVSPQNIIVGYSGQVKLIDFGVARAASQSQKTQAGILKGKFGYMSPEMIRGLPVDHRSDVFAMGICLHEALTGSRLFFGETDFATLELVRDAKVLPPSAKVPGIHPALDAVVLKALARDVENRFQSAEEMQLALEEVLIAHYAGYGEGDVGVTMRQAFAHEVTREKQRLEVFSHMLERGALVRGARIPALPSDPPPASGERSAAGLSTLTNPPVPTKKSTLTEEEARRLSDEQDVHDEQTQIFFSAAELDEIREIASEPRASLPHEPVRTPAISDVIMSGGRWSPSNVRESAPPARPVTWSGTYQKVGDTQARAARPTSQDGIFDNGRMPTLQFPIEPAQGSATLDGGPTRRGMSYLVLGLCAFALVVLGYTFTRLAQSDTGTLEIAAVGDPDALVRIDGVVRGNPPLVVKELAPGLHALEVEAKGYNVARRKVHVGPGEVVPVSLVLERVSKQPEVKGFGPVVEPRHVAPATIELGNQPPATPATDVTPPDREHARRTKWRPSSNGEPSGSPVVASAPAGETQVDEAANAEAAADGQGELLISTLPWSRVFIDNMDTGRDTPVRALRVPEGAHRIGLRTPDGMMHYVDVFIEAGQVVRIIRRF